MNTIQITERTELKTSQILQLIRDKFPVYSYYTDEQLDKDVPTPTETTTRFFLSQQDPDTETLGMSYNQFTKKGLPVITIREYMLLFLAYHEQTGKHLDEKGWTRTSTLDSDGDLMCGDWYDGKFRLDYGNRGNQSSVNGPRSAVLPFSTSSFNPSEMTEDQAVSYLKSKGYSIAKQY